MPLAIMVQVLSLLLASVLHPSLCSRSNLRLPVLKQKRKNPSNAAEVRCSDTNYPHHRETLQGAMKFSLTGPIESRLHFILT